MRQEINLFQPMFRRQKKVFSTVTMLQIVALFVVVQGALYAAQAYTLKPFERELARTGQDVARLRTQLQKLQRQSEPEGVDKLLEAEVARQTRELGQRRQVQEILKTGAFGNTRGFSVILEALARRHMDGTWITRVSIENGGEKFGFEGGTVSSELVPAYIQRLAQEPALAGISFNVLEVLRLEGTPNELQFIVRTN